VPSSTRDGSRALRARGKGILSLWRSAAESKRALCLASCFPKDIVPAAPVNTCGGLDPGVLGPSESALFHPLNGLRRATYLYEMLLDDLRRCLTPLQVCSQSACNLQGAITPLGDPIIEIILGHEFPNG
jgi:hypothetical protein